MTKTYLALTLLITVLAGNAYGEDEVYYCAEIDNNGFIFDEKLKKYKRSGFISTKFKIKLDRTAKTIEMKGNPSADATYNCRPPYSFVPEQLVCNEKVYQFNFNSNNGRFVLSLGYGYFGGDGDTISIAYGKCDKF